MNGKCTTGIEEVQFKVLCERGGKNWFRPRDKLLFCV